VYLELGAKRVFACSLEWPGLARAAKDEETALDALTRYVPRYAAVVERASLPVARLERATWEVVERVPTRSGGADFGVPTAVLARDGDRVTRQEGTRRASLLASGWELFDEAVAGAPTSLRKGPRGGGRDRDAIVTHVAAAEQMFAGRVGLNLPVPEPGATATVEANRKAVLDWCRSGQALPAARAAWPPRFATRRLVWHVLDHLWEIEDRRQ